ncbi:serine/threonine protein kinase [Streptomyces sp. SHP 1-2]|uniref:serine/threonine protein kinase n=1 Tax=Streptomyces sp. SHP 1-2 TaxID=2769489 RepID=UPI002238B8F3|nr:protein kinase [Streptomyces sp. SHP 1-2]MCW5254307.1 protein kinase [Streptomyces sp. SHP 1-2]
MTDFISPSDGGFTDARTVETRPVLDDVPPALADRFLLVRVVRAAERPGRAAVLRVRRAEPGASEVPLVLKYYHRLHAPDPAVAPVLEEAGAGSGHLERLLESGLADGHPYQVFRSHGETDLRAHLDANPGRMPAAAVREVARQLHEAVSVLHRHELVHRDITPDNVMVESLRGDELRLVLVDFGAAQYRPDEDDGPVRPWRGKPRYLAPEAGPLLQTVSPEADWWSVGMILAELALGEHPVDFFSDAAVLAEIATHDPDVSGIPDSRLRRLCEGLLTRRPEERWGAGEVGAWLEGRSPEVGRRLMGGRAPEEPAGITPFSFLDERFTEPEHLAQALDHYPVKAARLLADAGNRAGLAEWLGQFGAAGRHSAGELEELAELRAGLAEVPDPAAVVRLITWLGPYRDASLWRIPLSPEGVRELGAAVRRGDVEASRLVEHLWRTPAILTELARRPRGEGLDEVRERWTALCSRWTHLVDEVRRSPGIARLDRVRRALRTTTAVRARLLVLAREPERAARALAAETGRTAAALAAPVPWFERLLLAGRDDPLRLLVASLLVEQAVTEADARHRRATEEEIERLMDEDTDGVIAVLRRMDLPPTLSWALVGATVVIAPWCFVIALADVLDRASQESVVAAWMQITPAAAAVFAAELLTAVYIGPPAYHPRRSLAGLLIRSSERPARLTLSRRLTLLLGAAVLVGLVLLGFVALTYAPWVWPLAGVAAVTGWSGRRCYVWRRERRARAARLAGVRARRIAPRQV